MTNGFLAAAMVVACLAPSNIAASPELMRPQKQHTGSGYLPCSARLAACRQASKVFLQPAAPLAQPQSSCRSVCRLGIAEG